MIIKASLHLHTAEDRREGKKIKYSVYQLIDQARRLDFKVLAMTNHDYYTYRPEFGDYAEKSGMLLIPGVEKTIKQGFIKKNHVVVLNCQPDINEVRTFGDLIAYKKGHPEIFIIAPHPNFFAGVSMGIKNLIRYIDLFDAIEYSWFYTKMINFNNRAAKIARKYKKPLISTSDLHNIKFLNGDYALIDAPSLTPPDLFAAIRKNQFKNVTSPKKLQAVLAYIIGIKKKTPIKTSD